jgi:hypothetical protein
MSLKNFKIFKQMMNLFLVINKAPNNPQIYRDQFFEMIKI